MKHTEKNSENSIALVATPVQVITKESVMQLLLSFFNALEDATGGPVMAVELLEQLTGLLKEEPALFRQLATPENIAKMTLLAEKGKAGTIGLSDILQAFPQVTSMIKPAQIFSGITSFMAK